MKHPRKKPELAAIILLCGIALVGMAVFLPLLTGPTNCGGNSAALSACRSVQLSFRIISRERGAKPVSVADLSGQEREYFRAIPGMSWLPHYKLLVAPGPVLVAQQKPK